MNKVKSKLFMSLKLTVLLAFTPTQDNMNIIYNHLITRPTKSFRRFNSSWICTMVPVTRVITSLPTRITFSVALISVRISLASGKHSSLRCLISLVWAIPQTNEIRNLQWWPRGGGDSEMFLKVSRWFYSAARTVSHCGNKQHCAKDNDESEQHIITRCPLKNLP